jgi:chorismate lyase
LRRQVWLRTASGQRLAYAASWWSANQVDEYLRKSFPTDLGKSLAVLHGIVSRCAGTLLRSFPELEIAFREKGAFWGRHYLFWHARQPLTLIYEVFSPYLRKYLGEMKN